MSEVIVKARRLAPHGRGRELGPYARGRVIGVPGADGDQTISYTAAAAIGGHKVVRSVSAGVDLASADDLARAVGVAGVTTHAAVSGAPVLVRFWGLMTEPTWTWTPGLPVFLGLNGALVQTVPVLPGSLAAVKVGTAITATSIQVEIAEPVRLA